MNLKLVKRNSILMQRSGFLSSNDVGTLNQLIALLKVYLKHL